MICLDMENGRKDWKYFTGCDRNVPCSAFRVPRSMFRVPRSGLMILYRSNSSVFSVQCSWVLALCSLLCFSKIVNE